MQPLRAFQSLENKHRLDLPRELLRVKVNVSGSWTYLGNDRDPAADRKSLVGERSKETQAPMPDSYQLPAIILTALLLPAFAQLYLRSRETRTLLWFLGFLFALPSHGAGLHGLGLWGLFRRSICTRGSTAAGFAAC